MFFSFDHLSFRYDPFPIGLAKPLMEDCTYREFVENFPAIDMFEDYKAMEKPGDKYTLSEKENPRVYNDFVQSNPVWREFHRWIKSDEFVYVIMDTLKEHHIDLGYHYVPAAHRLARRIKDISRGRFCARVPHLRARFEFSALPSNGGHIIPHTDSLSKVVTMIISIVHEGEWDPAIGGGTNVNRPKDIRRVFNRLNKLASFEEMEVLQTFEFTPNQGIIFVKTFNSWHSVQPMTGSGSNQLRKTLTVNIEALR